MKIAVFPGSFDPITNGHIDIIKKALKLFDKIYVLIAINDEKAGRFTFEDRMLMAITATKDLGNVDVVSTQGFTVDFAKSVNASYLIRGIRDEKDFMFEKKLSYENKRLNKNIETILFVADDKLASISSSYVISLHKEGKDVSQYVPECVIDKLKKL